MREWTPRIIVVVLLAVVVGVPLLFQKKESVDASAAAGARLVIYSPHNQNIRLEFTRAFNDFRRAQNRPTVAIDWRSSGGTKDLRKTMLSLLEAKAQVGREDERIGAD